MNSVVGPIFNEKFAEKVKFVGPMNIAQVHCSRKKNQNMLLKEKKKKKGRKSHKRAKHKRAVYPK